MWHRAFKAELSRALRGRWFKIALAIGCMLAVASFAFDAQTYWTDYGYMVTAREKYDLTNTTLAVKSWMGTDLQPTSLIFYLLVPLLALAPYSWSLCSELKSGYAAQMVTRMGARGYYLAKAAVTFVISGFSASLPLLLSCCLAFVAAPNDVPNAHNWITLSWPINPYDVGSWLFFNRPMAYMAMWVAWGFICAGLWGLCVLAVSSLFRNRVALIAGAYGVQLGLYALGLSIPSAFGSSAWMGIDLITAMLPVYYDLHASILSMLIYLVVSASISALIPILGRKRDLL